ncbi:MAG: hypothetical protein E2P01_11055 [Acidobacteria bacterium]|nr:MAG: hypothetical protein E2P01_11055 [Acidobacteriota bacterium]
MAPQVCNTAVNACPEVLGRLLEVLELLANLLGRAVHELAVGFDLGTDRLEPLLDAVSEPRHLHLVVERQRSGGSRRRDR